MESANNNGPGRFITVEGLEGAGKSSQVEAMRAQIEDRGHRVVVTREPGGAPMSEQVRGLLLDPANTGMADDTELLLVFAARAEHLHKVIRPALEAGSWVVCDRFTDATYAYQGGGRGISAERIARLERWVQGSLRPDLSLILDVDPQTGLTRAGRRSDQDRFEQENVAFFRRVRECYLQRARANPGRYRVVDASGSMQEVGAEIAGILQEFR
jgi:dTMP kinase